METLLKPGGQYLSQLKPTYSWQVPVPNTLYPIRMINLSLDLEKPKPLSKSFYSNYLTAMMYGIKLSPRSPALLPNNDPPVKLSLYASRVDSVRLQVTQRLPFLAEMDRCDMQPHTPLMPKCRRAKTYFPGPKGGDAGLIKELEPKEEISLVLTPGNTPSVILSSAVSGTIPVIVASEQGEKAELFIDQPEVKIASETDDLQQTKQSAESAQEKTGREPSGSSLEKQNKNELDQELSEEKTAMVLAHGPADGIKLIPAIKKSEGDQFGRPNSQKSACVSFSELSTE